MQITIDTSQELSEVDSQILALLTGVTITAELAEAAPAKPAAKKAAPAKAEPEPDVEEDILGEAPTLADAVAAATKLVSNGEAAKVKEALVDLSVKKVSDLTESDIPAFLAALDA